MISKMKKKNTAELIMINCFLYSTMYYLIDIYLICHIYFSIIINIFFSRY